MTRCLTLYIVLVIFFTGSCRKKDSPETLVQSFTKSQFAQNFNLQGEASDIFIQELNKTDTIEKAVYNTGVWLVQHSEVKKVTMVASLSLEIEYTSGVNSVLSFSSLDSNLYDYRSGGNTSSFHEVQNSLSSGFSNKKSDKIIENKNVLLFNPYESEFYGNYYPLEKFSQGIVPLNVTKIADTDASITSLSEFQNKGLIIINTHGQKGSFHIKTKANVSREPWFVRTENELVTIFMENTGASWSHFETKELLPALTVYYNKQGNNYVKDGGKIDILVTTKYVRKYMKLDNSVVVLNFCFSGHQVDGKEKDLISAFTAAGAKSIYAYQDQILRGHPVVDKACQRIEEIFINNLVINGELTGDSNEENPTEDPPMENADMIRNNINSPGWGLKFLYSYTIVPNDDGSYDAYSTVIGKNDQHGWANVPIYFKHFGDPDYKYEGCGCGTFTDERDDEVYKLACIGNRTWFAENLRYNAVGSKVAEGLGSDSVGRLYTFNQATGGIVNAQDGSYLEGICPNGWHIPARLDWLDLMQSIGVTTDDKYFFRPLDDGGQISPFSMTIPRLQKFNSNWALWLADTPDSLYNNSCFSMIPTQKASDMNETRYASFWSSSPPARQHPKFVSPELADKFDYGVSHKFMFSYNNSFLFNQSGVLNSNENFASCRCVKD